MASDDLSISGISANKLDAIAQKFQVAIVKKAIDSQGQVAKLLIDSATSSAPPPGKGQRINTVA